jgi:hypothetical protein
VVVPEISKQRFREPMPLLDSATAMNATKPSGEETRGVATA